MLNGIAKIWHSHVRGSVGLALLSRYDPLQLGGRRRIPVSFAVATFRNAWDLSVQQGRCVAALFVDIQAAYYETSRQLLFHGDTEIRAPEAARLSHLARLSQALASEGALKILGTPAEEVDLLLDCVACSHWQLVGSENTFLATRGSRPGDGLADILFGALFSIGLRHIRAVCAEEGIAHLSSGELIGRPGEVIPVGWADDLAVLADFAEPRELEIRLPRLAEIVVTTLEFLRFRVNLGRGKTEAIVDIRGTQAKSVRGTMLAGEAALALPDQRTIRLAPEYRYLGVLQLPRDTGRRDQELCAQRAQTAWAQARSLLTSESLPWPLKQAWIAGRVLPAAYATVGTNIAVSQRATAPLEGFFERATRTLLRSWRYGHHLTKPCLYALAGLTAPAHATIYGRVRLVTQLCQQAPAPVWDIFEAAWNRATDWCGLLTDACQRLLPAAMPQPRPAHVTLQVMRSNVTAFLKACKHLSRHGTTYWAFWELWRDVGHNRTTTVLGAPGTFTCALCHKSLPSHQALAAHIHRKHSVVNCLTLYTLGSTCLWCHTNHFSTDRLKYHLQRSPRCLHGLRVVVGTSYTYGSGSKRVGAGGHRGLPPQRLPGPINATPAERHAASQDRAATDAELAAELLAYTGSNDVFSWPDASTGNTQPTLPTLPPNSMPTVGVVEDPSDEKTAVRAGDAVTPQIPRWRMFLDAAHPDAQAQLSPFWPGLAGIPTCWGLPSSWHGLWSLWAAAELSDDPWDLSVRRAQRPLRAGGAGHGGPSAALACLLANTVTFRLICQSVTRMGMLWIAGVPSTRGINLLRRLLPLASFSVIPSGIGSIFIAAHASCDQTSLVPQLQAALLVQSGSPPWQLLQPSFVYRTRSQV